VVKPSPEKVYRIAFQEVAVPEWLGQLIEYFIQYVRPGLEPKKTIQAIWINSKGRPLGKQLIVTILTVKNIQPSLIG
jgi:hypothetical protein